jgi:hypothetical protein
MRIFLISLSLLVTSFSHANDEQQQINFIQKQFDQVRDHNQIWQWGWFGFLGTAATVQGIGASVVDDDKLQYDMTVGAITSFLGAADMLLNPIKTHNYSDQLQDMKSNNAAESASKLAQAESWLAQAAAREAYEQSWTNHLLGGLVNGLAGLAVAYDDKRPIDGWLTFATGVAVTEFKIYTAPQEMMRAQQTYQSGNLNAETVYRTKNSEPSRWKIASAGPNLMVNWAF